MTSSRRRHRKAGTNKFKPSQQANSNPEEPFDWPGVFEHKYIDDIRTRLNSLENAQVTDDFIKAFLSAHNNDNRHAVEGIKQTLYFRKGRQMFYNHYRTTLQRYMFLQSCRTQGIGPASTFGHAKDGRIIFYEKIANWNLPFHKEFSEVEFIDHVITWCELLYSMALANNGQSPLIIHPPSLHSSSHSKNDIDGKDSKTSGDAAHDSDAHTEAAGKAGAADTDAGAGKAKPSDTNGAEPGKGSLDLAPHDDDDDDEEDDEDGNSSTRLVSPPSVEVENDFVFHTQPRRIDPNCKYADVIGIVDWLDCDEGKLLANENLLLAAEGLISKHYPFLFYRLIHVNMPMTFDSIFKKLKPKMNQQTILKSVFYETEATKQARAKFVKNALRKQRSMRRVQSTRSKIGDSNDSEKADSENGASGKGSTVDKEVTAMLAKIIDKEFLPKEYGGDAQNAFKKCDSMFANLIGYSAISEDETYDEYDDDDNEDSDEKDAWQTVPLNKGERHTIRKTVERGQHWRWEYNIAETGASIFFGVTYECAGYRAKALKIAAREEIEHKCSFYPIYGDFVTLKEGKLLFQFRNVPRGKRINLKYKITCETLPIEHVNKFLPTYQAEEKMLIMESTEHLNSRRRLNISRGNAKTRNAKTPEPSRKKKGPFTSTGSKSTRTLLSEDDEPNPEPTDDD